MSEDQKHKTARTVAVQNALREDYAVPVEPLQLSRQAQIRLEAMKKQPRPGQTQHQAQEQAYDELYAQEYPSMRLPGERIKPAPRNFGARAEAAAKLGWSDTSEEAEEAYEMAQMQERWDRLTAQKLRGE
jgi:hypothetical protein